MKKRILTGLTLVLTVLFSFGLLSAAEKTASPAKRSRKNAAMIAQLLPPELNRSLNLVPEDAIAAGFVNVEVITRGKLFPEMLKAVGMDWDALIAAAGGKKEDADACALFYIRLSGANADVAQMITDPAMEIGGSIVYKRAEAVREQFEKSAEDIRKGIVGADPEAAQDVKVEKTKVGDKDAIRISMPSHKLTAISIAAGKNIIQFRCFLNTEPVLALIPARGEITPLASSLNLKSAFSIAVDGVRLRALDDDMQGTPEFKAVHRISCSGTEREKGLAIVLRIASDLDGAQLIQGKIKDALNGMKEDVMLGSIASRTSVKLEKGTNVVVRTSIPSEMIVQYLLLCKEMEASETKDSGAAAEPAAK